MSVEVLRTTDSVREAEAEGAAAGRLDAARGPDSAFSSCPPNRWSTGGEAPSARAKPKTVALVF